MPKQYQPAVFQPTIRPSWAGSFEYISTEELSQILKAITVFPNIDLPNSAFWNQTVKPDLEQQYQNFRTTCEKRGRGARTYWGEHKLSLCYTYDNHKDTKSITQGNLCKDKDKNKDESKEKNNIFNEDSIIYVNGQYFDEFPPESIPTLKKYWSASELEEIRKDLAFKPEHQTTVAQMLLNYPPKPKKKQVEVTDYGEYEPLREQITKWIDYKKARKESYKTEQSLMSFAKKLFTLSGGNQNIADQIIEQSMANNWAGIFNLKTQPKKQEKINWGLYVGDGSFLRDPKDDPLYADIFNKKD